jgi:hypothetical protein
MEGPGQGYPLTPMGTTAQEARPQPWRMSHGGVWQIWAECFTGSLVALPVLAASPPAVPLLPLTHRWWGGGRPPPALVTIGMPIAPSIRLPLGWTPDGVLSCHPYARRGGERDGRAPTPPRGAYAGHGQHDGLVVTAVRPGGVLRRPHRPPRGEGTAGTPCRHGGHGHSGPAKTSPQSPPHRPAPPPGRRRSTPGSRPPGAPTQPERSATATTGRGRQGLTSTPAVGMTPTSPERWDTPTRSSGLCSTPPNP